MPEQDLWHHRAFDDMFVTLEARKIGRERIAEVVRRLLVLAPKTLPPQSEIAQGRGLAVPYEIPADSVSRSTAALAGMSLVTQHKAKADRPGRPYTPLQLGSARWAMVGVKIGHDEGRAVTLNVVVTGLDGTPLELAGYQSEDQPYIRNIDEPADLVDVLGEVIEELCDLPAVRHRRILGVGVEIAGHVFEGDVLDATLNNIRTERTEHLGRQLSQRLDRLADRFDDRGITKVHRPLPVILDNDVNALAVLETYRPRYPDRDLAVVAMFDDGIGLGLIMDGRVYRGGHGMAGEIGHCLIPIDADEVRALDADATSGSDTNHNGIRTTRTEHPPPRGFLDECHCGGDHHLDCITPVRILGQLGEHDLEEIAGRPAEDHNGLTREGRAFKIAARGLGIGISTLINLVNPSRVLLLLPPYLAQSEPGSAGDLYTRIVDKTWREHAFSTAAATTNLDVQPFSADQRRFFGAQAAAVRVIDSFIQHGKHRCKCYVPLPQPKAIPADETDIDAVEDATNNLVRSS